MFAGPLDASHGMRHCLRVMLFTASSNITACLSCAANIVMFEDSDLGHMQGCDTWLGIIERNAIGGDIWAMFHAA